MFAILSSTGAGSGLEVISVTWDTRLSGGTDQFVERKLRLSIIFKGFRGCQEHATNKHINQVGDKIFRK